MRRVCGVGGGPGKAGSAHVRPESHGGRFRGQRQLGRSSRVLEQDWSPGLCAPYRVSWPHLIRGQLTRTPAWLLL